MASILQRPLSPLVPIAAAAITVKTRLFSAIHLSSGATDQGPMTYWLVVAALSGCLAYARLVLMPL